MDEQDLFDEREPFKPFSSPFGEHKQSDQQRDQRDPYSHSQSSSQSRQRDYHDYRDSKSTERSSNSRDGRSFGVNKQRVCIHYQINACRRGDSCGFLHEYRELIKCATDGCNLKTEQKFCPRHWKEKKMNYQSYPSSNSNSNFNPRSNSDTYQTKSTVYNSVRPPVGLYDTSSDRNFQNFNSHSRSSSSSHSHSHSHSLPSQSQSMSQSQSDSQSQSQSTYRPRSPDYNPNSPTTTRPPFISGNIDDLKEELEMRKMFEGQISASDSVKTTRNKNSVPLIDPDLVLAHPLLFSKNPTQDADYFLDEKGSPVHKASSGDMGDHMISGPPSFNEFSQTASPYQTKLDALYSSFHGKYPYNPTPGAPFPYNTGIGIAPAPAPVATHSYCPPAHTPDPTPIHISSSPLLESTEMSDYDQQVHDMNMDQDSDDEQDSGYSIHPSSMASEMLPKHERSLSLFPEKRNFHLHWQR